METLETVNARYEAYLSLVAQLRREKSPYRDMLGFRGGVRDDRCHGEFIEELCAALRAPDGVETAQAAEIVAFVLHAPANYERDGLLCWTFLAAQQAVLPLIGLLPPGDAASLAAWYGRHYPRVKRTPVQERVLARLKKQAGAQK